VARESLLTAKTVVVSQPNAGFTISRQREKVSAVANAGTDFLDAKRDEINARVTELKPLVDEYERLRAAILALDGASATTAAPRRGNGRATNGSRARSVNANGTGRRRGRPKGSGPRAIAALELVRSNPGVTIAELAEKMGIKRNYLYRVLDRLADDGLVRKDGAGWHPKA
jgi:CRP-like cAMP-binding protein